MVSVSIACLIYQSTKLADWVYDSVHEFTPMINRGDAEFFFVANDPTEGLLSHLKARRQEHIVQNNEILADAELFRRGYAWPEYIRRIYQGYNRAVLHAQGKIIVLVNSDHFFSPDWLENLLKYLDARSIVCSQLVEPKHPRFPVFHSAVNAEFGRTPGEFDKSQFIKFAMKIGRTGLYPGGAFMPCAFYREVGIRAGLYPEGNLAGASFDKINMTGDEAFFMKLAEAGVKHVTSLDSIVYHLKEGEKDDGEGQARVSGGSMSRSDDADVLDLGRGNLSAAPGKGNYENLIQSPPEHAQMMDKLMHEFASLRMSQHELDTRYPLVTVITPTYNRADYLSMTIESVLQQDYPNLQYIVLDDGSKDNTKQILERYSGRILWDFHPNMGETRTVNKGFKMAKGDFVCVVNSDDPIRPTAITELAAALNANPEALAAYPDWVEIDSASRTVNELKLPDYDLALMLNEFNVAIGPGTLFRRSVLEQYGYRDVKRKYTGDLEFWFRLALHGRLIHVAKPLATHRTHPDSASVREKGPRIAEELVSIVKSMLAARNLPGELRAGRRRILSHTYEVAVLYCPRDPFHRSKYTFLAFLTRPRPKVQVMLRSSLALLYPWVKAIIKRILVGLVSTIALLLKMLLPEKVYHAMRSRWRGAKRFVRGQ